MEVAYWINWFKSNAKFRDHSGDGHREIIVRWPLTLPERKAFWLEDVHSSS